MAETTLAQYNLKNNTATIQHYLNSTDSAAACTLSMLPAHYQHDLHCHSTEQTGHFTVTNSAAACTLSMLPAHYQHDLHSHSTEYLCYKLLLRRLFYSMDKDELPPHWDRDLLFGLDDSSGNSDSDAGFDSDVSPN
ncbi:unnamed protein product, partial [Timema podura]|nr:unnamed protein product [Timema podura]